jgi:hypothetical protein
MPTATPPGSHSKQAEHNERFARQLCSGDGPYDWSITIAFYAALHFVEHWLRTKKKLNALVLARQNGESPHVWRGRLIEHNCTMATQISYASLRQQSELARYLSSHSNVLKKSAFEFFGKEAAELQLVQLEQIKREVA